MRNAECYELCVGKETEKIETRVRVVKQNRTPEPGTTIEPIFFFWFFALSNRRGSLNSRTDNSLDAFTITKEYNVFDGLQTVDGRLILRRRIRVV